MKKPMLFATLLSLTAWQASALTNQALIYYQSDFRNSTVVQPLGDWTCFGDGKTAKDVNLGQSGRSLLDFFPAGSPAYVPIELDEIGLAYFSNSTTAEGRNVSEWLVSPAIDLSGVSQNALLSYDVVAYGSVTQPRYEIYYSTTGNRPEDFVNKLYTGKQTNSEVLPISTRKYLSIKDIKADSVYFAFANISKNAQILGFKNISVEEYGLDLTNNTPAFVDQPGEYKVEMNLKLMTPVICSGFTVELDCSQWDEPQVYNDDRQLGNSELLANVAFDKPISLKQDESVNYTVTLRPNYEGATASRFDFSISCTEGYPAVCVEEEATGTWCGYCVRGIAGLNQFSAEYPDRFIGIAVHSSNDPMYVGSYYTPLNEQAHITGLPAAWFNRTELSDPYSRSVVEKLLAARVGYSVNVKSVRFDENTGRASVDYGVKLAINTNSAAVNAVVVVTEDGVTGTTPQWNQTNYYSGTDRATIEKSYGADAWKYFEPYCSEPKSIPFTKMKYDHVARGIFNSYAGGGKGGYLPETWQAGVEQVFTLSFDMPEVQNWKNTHVTVMLLDANSGQVLNAARVGADTYVTDPASLEDVSGTMACKISAVGSEIRITGAAAGAEIRVFNTLGYCMASATADDAGAASVDCPALAGSVALVQVTDGASTHVGKIAL